MYIFFCDTVEGRVVDSNMDGFSSSSSNLFAIFIYYLELGDIGSGVVVGNAEYINHIVDITIVFFYSVFQVSARFSCVQKVAIFFWQDH